MQIVYLGPLDLSLLEMRRKVIKDNLSDTLDPINLNIIYFDRLDCITPSFGRHNGMK